MEFNKSHGNEDGGINFVRVGRRIYVVTSEEKRKDIHTLSQLADYHNLHGRLKVSEAADPASVDAGRLVFGSHTILVEGSSCVLHIPNDGVKQEARERTAALLRAKYKRKGWRRFNPLMKEPRVTGTVEPDPYRHLTRSLSR